MLPNGEKSYYFKILYRQINSINFIKLYFRSFVRLGEYDIDSETDCTGTNDCADPVQDISVREIMVHPDYDPRAKDRYHDIGLVRLSRPASYSGECKIVVDHIL